MRTPAGSEPDPSRVDGERGRSSDLRTADTITIPVVTDDPPASPTRRHLGGVDRLSAIVLVCMLSVLVVVSAVGVILAARNAAGSEENTATPVRTFESVAETPSAPAPGAISQIENQGVGSAGTVRDGDLTFVVRGVETTTVLTDPATPAVTMTADGTYIVIRLTVTNVGAVVSNFLAGANTISDGVTDFPADVTPRPYVAETEVPLAPGQSADTAVVFDVPTGTDVTSMRLRADPASVGVQVPV